MSDVQEIYLSSIRRLPADARLRLAALILHDLADEKAAPSRRFALEILDELPGGSSSANFLSLAPVFERP
ncbi:MAG: hypothetical protein KIT57_14055 [Blastocatellales bacterium]|nr:hypothetical protein [Blastocatellales bacterium]